MKKILSITSLCAILLCSAACNENDFLEEVPLDFLSPENVYNSYSGMQSAVTGLYHQVRRMFAAVGNHVETLERIAIGPVVLDRNLGEGGWRFLTEEEVAQLS